MQNFTFSKKIFAYKLFDGSKIVRLLPKMWRFLGKKNCALFCALFGQSRCAFQFKIIKNSVQKPKIDFIKEHFSFPKKFVEHFCEKRRIQTPSYIKIWKIPNENQTEYYIY